MTARMRWGAVGDSPVPWLASVAAVMLVLSLAWLATDEPSGASIGPVDRPPAAGPLTTLEPAREFSGVAVLAALIIEAPSPQYEPIPDGQDGAGPRTLDTVAAQADAVGQSGADVADDLRVSGYRGGLTKGWINRSDGNVLFVTMDEFGDEEGALGWAGGLRAGLAATKGASELEGPVDQSSGVRIDVDTPDGAQHQILYVVWRGRRVALVQLATFGEIDAALIERLARAQAERLQAAAP